jgi:hypothetical protein
VARTVPVADDQRQSAELAEWPAVEPDLGGHGVRLGLFDHVEPLLEPAGLEPAGAGEHVPRRCQIALDQPSLASCLPCDRGPSGDHQAEQQQDQQTTKHEPPG